MKKLVIDCSAPEDFIEKEKLHDLESHEIEFYNSQLTKILDRSGMHTTAAI